MPRPAQHPNQGLLPLRAIDDGAPEHARLRRVFRRAGYLPVASTDAPLLGLKAAVALDCDELAETLEWDRKNYSYPGPPEGLPDHAGEDAPRAIW